MYKVTVDLTRLQQGLKDLQNRFPTVVMEGLEEIADKAKTDAQSTVHVITGELRDSIQITEKGKDYIIVAATAEHAAAEEYGTIYREPHPYMGVTADRMETEAPRIMLTKLKQTL